MLKNSPERYGIVARSFHWILAILMISIAVAGIIMVGMEASPQKFQIYDLHKALGIIVLTLAIARIAWKFMNVQPMEIVTHKRWEKILSKIVHTFFYVAMVGMPMSGWAMSSAAGYPVSMFGLFDLPNLFPENKEILDEIKLVHKFFGYSLLAIIGLHMAGALKHHFIDKDATLRRMLPFYRS